MYFHHRKAIPIFKRYTGPLSRSWSIYQCRYLMNICTSKYIFGGTKYHYSIADYWRIYLYSKVDFSRICQYFKVDFEGYITNQKKIREIQWNIQGKRAKVCYTNYCLFRTGMSYSHYLYFPKCLDLSDRFFFSVAQEKSLYDNM